MEIKVVSFDTLCETMGQEMLHHWEEVGFKEGNLDLDLDIEIYHQAEQTGHARFYMVYQDDIAIGYASVLSSHMIQHKEQHQAVTDSYYVVPKYRGQGVFPKLVDYIEEDCRKCGISYFAIAFPPERSKATSKLLERKGYFKREITYSKYLGE